MGTAIRPAAAPQLERKAPFLDFKNVWTLMGFWALLQAGALGPSCIVGMVCPAPHLLEEIRSHPRRKIAWISSSSVDTDAGLVSDANRSFCWGLSSFYTQVYFVLK